LVLKDSENQSIIDEVVPFPCVQALKIFVLKTITAVRVVAVFIVFIELPRTQTRIIRRSLID
jgi:hypothetical protein